LAPGRVVEVEAGELRAVLFQHGNDLAASKYGCIPSPIPMKPGSTVVVVGAGADSVLECVGTQEAMWQAIHAARPGGSVGYVGVPHGVALDGCPAQNPLTNRTCLTTFRSRLRRYRR
jgi:threonine dehydrogenase-like Zn-dependent dehydrogenase